MPALGSILLSPLDTTARCMTCSLSKRGWLLGLLFNYLAADHCGRGTHFRLTLPHSRKYIYLVAVQMADTFFTPTLHPPLGATTVVRRKDGRIRFTACMSVSGASAVPSDHFTVLLWWSVDGRGPWSPAHFTPADGDIVFGQSGGRRDTFSLELEYAGGEPLQFCLKYRFADGPWYTFFFFSSPASRRSTSRKQG
jgi:hypothetical protein